MPAPKRDFTKTEIKAGFLVLFSGLIFAIFLAAVLGYRPAGDGNIYHAYFSNTSGLRPGADVRFGGLKAGRVVAIEPAPGDQSMIRTTVVVSADVPVNTESVAFVTQTSLTSDFHLEITTGEPGAALLESGADVPAGSGGLFGEMENLAKNVGGVLEDVTVLLGVRDADGAPTMPAEDVQTLAELLGGVDGLVGDLQTLVGVADAEGNPTMTDEELRTAAEIFQRLDGAVDEGNVLLASLNDTLDENRPALKQAVDGLVEVEDSAVGLMSDLSSVLNDNRENIDSALTNLNKTLESAETLVQELESLTGSLDGFFGKNEPVLEDILLDLREVMRNLDEFSRTLSEQPQSIIRGKQVQGRQ